MNARKLPKNVVQMASGRYRLQIRRSGFATVDQIFDTVEGATAARTRELDRQNEAVLEDGPTMSLHQAARRYFESPEFSDKAARTQYEERHNIVPVLAALGDNSLIYIAKNLSIVAQYRDRRRQTVSARTKKKLGPAKVRVELAALSSIYLWAVANAWFPANPLIGIKRGVSPQMKRRYEGNEEANLMTVMQKGKDAWARQIARFLLTLVECGCRTAELADVNLDDIDLAARTMRFRDTKNRTDRTIHLTDVALEYVGDQMLDAELAGQLRLYRTIGRRGAEVPYNYGNWVKRLRAGKIVRQGFIAYAGRKEFVSRGMENDISIVTLQQMTGHKNLQSIERYRVDIQATPQIKRTLDAHSETQALAAAERQIAALPPELRQMFYQRIKDRQR